MKILAYGLALPLMLAPLAANAEVLDSAPGGFTVHTTLNIRAAPDDVYRRLVHNVGDWWDPVHTFSHDAHNLSIEERAAGCFCEKLQNGGGVSHMEVIFIVPGKSLVMHGVMGPLMSKAVTGGMEIQLSPAEEGTKLEVTFAATGYLPAGLTTWAPIFDRVVKQQFTRLKNYIEQGNPVPKEEKR